ncbi:MAG: AAA family ATPase [Planctomycetota bacterium]
MPPRPREPFIENVDILHGYFPLESAYVGEIPAVKATQRLKLHPKATFFIGENGTGKSTLLEAIAVADGFNAEGGTRNFNFATRASHSDLYKWIRLGRSMRGKRRKDGFFMRAESFYNVATEIEKLGVSGYGDYHNQSHGEAFLHLITDRLRGDGLYLFDEPEAALSPQRQLVFLAAMHFLIERESQFVIATHSPIIMAYPEATIYEFSSGGIRQVAYRDTEHFRVMHAFLSRTDQMLEELFKDE